MSIWLVVKRGKLCLIGTTDFAQTWFLAQLGQSLAGHLWASQSCCDCVISLLMKKSGETFDLENA